VEQGTLSRGLPRAFAQYSRLNKNLYLSNKTRALAAERLK